MSPNVKGAGLMTGSMAAFTLNDVFVKLLAETVPLFQIVFLRGILTTILLTATVAMFGKLTFRIPRGDRLKVAVRTICEVLTVMAFLTALVNMAIANATAILSALPLVVTLGAAILFREPVGWRRWSAIAVGAVGVLLIVQPGAEGFNIYSLWALAAAVFVAGRDLSTRAFSDQMPLMSVAVLTSAAVGVFGGVMSLSIDWVPMGPEEFLYLSGSALFIIGGYVLSILVMRVGDVAAVSPFRYTGLVFALILGVAVFEEFPNTLALAGAAIVVATGGFTLIRERQLAHG